MKTREELREEIVAKIHKLAEEIKTTNNNMNTFRDNAKEIIFLTDTMHYLLDMDKE